MLYIRSYFFLKPVHYRLYRNQSDGTRIKMPFDKLSKETLGT